MYYIVKRLFDISLSLVILLALSPFLLVIVAVLLCTGEHEVFYLQRRVGYKNKIFKIVKFATMLKNSPNMGTGSLTLRNDPRVTQIGHFLRISKINELPQLLNVLKGDMSFIGPRPLMPVDFNSYESLYKDNINLSKPGITGIGSILFRDEQKMISDSNMHPKQYYTEYILPVKGAVELWYQKHKSTKTDILILLITLWVLVFPKSKIVFRFFRDLPIVLNVVSISKSHLTSIAV